MQAVEFVNQVLTVSPRRRGSRGAKEPAATGYGERSMRLLVKDTVADGWGFLQRQP